MPWAANPPLEPEYVQLTWTVNDGAFEDALALAYRLPVGGVEYDDGTVAEAPFTDLAWTPAGPRFVRVYLPREEADAWVDVVRRVCAAHGWTLREDVVKSDDWAHSWKAHYQPQMLPGGYAVVPAWWERSPAPPDRTLWLDPGMAFGTGLHATTRLCLEALTTEPLGGCRVLDVGAGSGILALMALKAGAASAVLVEPDPVARDAIWHNARLNRLDGAVRVVHGTLKDLAPSPFDVVCMNLIWDIIREEWPRLLSYLAPKALVLLSGILSTFDEEVRALVQGSGDEVARVEERDGWLLVVVRHHSRGT
ncbi:MAG: 50S ribosomal protein L11 methyltransferase [Firmicutes bacterium]|nr:50S ribosomal protein L11 methyltransferase [Bacillota bacterium]